MSVDLSFLEQFAAGDKAKMAKYISIFLKSAPAMLGNIVSKQADGDWDGLRTAAHALKPQISYMGIKEMEHLIKTIEHNAGERNDLDKLPTMVAELKTGVEEAFHILQTELEKLNKG